MTGARESDPLDIREQACHLIPLRGTRPVVLAVGQRHRHFHIRIPTSRVDKPAEAAVDRSCNLRITLAAGALSKLDEKVLRQVATSTNPPPITARRIGLLSIRAKIGPIPGTRTDVMMNRANQLPRSSPLGSRNC